MLKKSFCFKLIYTFIFFILSSVAASAEFTDSENCMWCHRYPTLGRYDDKTGNKRIFYLNEESYVGSSHGKLKCTKCHLELDRIPHLVKGNVDCSVRCHIIDPSSGHEFSHFVMVKRYEHSVHGKGPEENPKPNTEDLPMCQYCHDNHIYDHSDDTNHRQWLIRSQREVVELCASCHEDQKKMARHNLNVLGNYKDSFHYDQLKYGVENAPDCISCHVPTGYSSHDIRTGTDPLSSINMANRVKTCSGEGEPRKCHPDATAEFAEGRVHTYGIKAKLLSGESIFNVEGRFKALMNVREKENISKENIYQYMILEVLRLFYKLLIAGVVIFMGSHQILDYIRVRKNHKASHGEINKYGN